MPPIAGIEIQEIADIKKYSYPEILDSVFKYSNDVFEIPLFFLVI